MAGMGYGTVVGLSKCYFLFVLSYHLPYEHGLGGVSSWRDLKKRSGTHFIHFCKSLGRRNLSSLTR